jgi:hypothetical protein
MASHQSQFGLRCGIRTQPVSHQHVGREAVLFEQFAHQFHGCSLVASPSRQQIENLAFVVDRSPEPESPAGDQNCHLVQMPVRGGPMTSAAKFLGEQRPELQHLSSDRFTLARQPRVLAPEIAKDGKTARSSDWLGGAEGIRTDGHRGFRHSRFVAALSTREPNLTDCRVEKGVEALGR